MTLTLRQRLFQTTDNYHKKNKNDNIHKSEAKKIRCSDKYRVTAISYYIKNNLPKNHYFEIHVKNECKNVKID